MRESHGNTRTSLIAKRNHPTNRTCGMLEDSSVLDYRSSLSTETPNKRGLNIIPPNRGWCISTISLPSETEAGGLTSSRSFWTTEQASLPSPAHPLPPALRPLLSRGIRVTDSLSRLKMGNCVPTCQCALKEGENNSSECGFLSPHSDGRLGDLRRRCWEVKPSKAATRLDTGILDEMSHREQVQVDFTLRKPSSTKSSFAVRRASATGVHCVGKHTEGLFYREVDGTVKDHGVSQTQKDTRHMVSQ